MQQFIPFITRTHAEPIIIMVIGFLLAKVYTHYWAGLISNLITRSIVAFPTIGIVKDHW